MKEDIALSLNAIKLIKFLALLLLRSYIFIAKKLRPVLGLNKGLTLRLVGRGLKQLLNMEHALTNAHFRVHLCTVCIDFL